MADQTLQRIRELVPEMQDAAVAHINALRAAGLPAVILQSKRSQAQQRAYVKAGKSLTLRSKHLIGRAYDIGWLGVQTRDVPMEWWDYGGEVGEALGLKWGGRFKRLVDKPHFET